MKQLIPFPAVLILIGLALPAKADTIERPSLSLMHGEQRVVRIPGLARYSIGGTAIHATMLKNAERPRQAGGEPVERLMESLLVKGVSDGISDIWVWKKDGSSEHTTVYVDKNSEDRLSSALERAISRLEETEIIRAGKSIVLRGEISSLSESSRITALTQAFPKEVFNETTLANSLLNQGKGSLQGWLKSSGHDQTISIEEEGQSLVVRGNLKDTKLRPEIERQIKTIFPPAIIQLESLPDDAPTVHFKVFLLELKRNSMQSFGISWPAMQEGAFRVTSSGIKEGLALDLTIQAMEGDGSAKVLSRPELSVRAPGEAELFSGGELPIRNSTQYFSNITWKPFGLSLKLKVAETAGEAIRLEISTEVSSLDTAMSEEKIPGVRASRMKTQVDARFGTPLFLSGLLKEDTRNQAKGLPLLRQIPVLGALFGSSDYLNERSELVAILLPEKTPPKTSLEKVAEIVPKGPIPPPRNRLLPSDELALRASPEYPWNALQ